MSPFSSVVASPEELTAKTREFYLEAMNLLEQAGVPFLVGGAYSLAHHAGIVRHTKDFDVFVRKVDVERAMSAWRAGGYLTELVFPHWLGKAFKPRSEDFVDIIFSSGNGLCEVDDSWFEHAVEGTALGRRAMLVAAEEIIWTKSFIQERERYDGADIAHLLLARGPELNWERLQQRFGGHEQVLLAHLLLFTYIFPSERDRIPWQVVEALMERARERPERNGKLCRGTYISRAQYLPDVRERGFDDARLPPHGSMRHEDVDHWTAAIETIR